MKNLFIVALISLCYACGDENDRLLYSGKYTVDITYTVDTWPVINQEGEVFTDIWSIEYHPQTEEYVFHVIAGWSQYGGDVYSAKEMNGQIQFSYDQPSTDGRFIKMQLVIIPNEDQTSFTGYSKFETMFTDNQYFVIETSFVGEMGVTKEVTTSL